MKEIIKNTSIWLLFFLIFLFKESIYGLIINVSNIEELDTKINKIRDTYYQEEYFKLLESFDISLNDGYKYVYSKVLYRDIYDYFDEITILKGENDSLQKGQAILNEKGLIGIIKKVNKNSSVVSLITNKTSQISIQVNQSYGILKYQNNNLIIESINNYEDIEIGDVVSTSGIGNLPKGILIGEVSKVLNNDLGIEKQVVVTPYVDFNDLNYVAVLNGEN